MTDKTEEYVALELARAKAYSGKMPITLTQVDDVDKVSEGDVGCFAFYNNGRDMSVFTPAGVIRIPTDRNNTEVNSSPKWTYIERDGKITLFPALAVSIKNSKEENIELFYGYVRNGQIISADTAPPFG